MADETKTYPEGEYAIVEVMGHVRHTGRWQEVERFGQKFCQVEPIQDGQFQPPILVGAASIYQMHFCTAQHAWETAPTTWEYRRANQALLPAPSMEDEDDDIPFEYDDGRVE